jgi:hypothetical protein
MPQDSKYRRSRDVAVRRTGGAYGMQKAFALLDISPSFGYELIKAGKIRVVRLGPGSPKITDAEIERLLREGVEGTAYPRKTPGGEAA